MLPIHVPFIWEGLSDLDPRDRGQTLIPACSVFTVSSSKGEHGGTCKPRCLHLGGRRVSNMVFVFCVFLRGLIMLHVFPWPRTKYNLDDCPRGSCQLVTPYELWPHANIPLPLRNPPANYSTIIHVHSRPSSYLLVFSHLTQNHADFHSALLTYPTVPFHEN